MGDRLCVTVERFDRAGYMNVAVVPIDGDGLEGDACSVVCRFESGDLGELVARVVDEWHHGGAVLVDEALSAAHDNLTLKWRARTSRSRRGPQ